MRFDAADFLAGLFDDAPDTLPAAGAKPSTAPPTVPDGTAAGDSLASSDEIPGNSVLGTKPDDSTTVEDASAFGGQPEHSDRALPESSAVPDPFADWADEDMVPPPDPCPKCGGLATWWDMAGGAHCQRCESAGLAESFRLANRASHLRRCAVPRMKVRAKVDK